LESANKSDTCTNNGSLNHLKIIQKIPEQHTGKHEVKELQKTAMLGTAHIHQKVKVQSIQLGK
jgi:hypothetical protein